MKGGHMYSHRGCGEINKTNYVQVNPESGMFHEYFESLR